MSLKKSVRDQIDQLFADFDTPETPGCALGVIVDGQLVYTRGYGLADLEQQVPITPDTVFHLASVSKQFTAACIALLEEDGKISLDDEVKRYIPYLPDYNYPITLKHLVYMTNGLEDFYSVANLIMGIPEDEYFSQDNAIEIIKAANWLNFRPGECWSYGNTGYFLLGRVVEKVSGQPLSIFAREHIFSPLNMAHTFFRDDRRAVIPHRANGYARAEFLHYQDPSVAGDHGYYHHREPMNLSGAGQAWSTVNDLFLWDQNFYHNILGNGDPQLITRMTTPGILNNGTPTNYAFGLFVTEASGCKIISHEGGAPGANTVIYRIPDKKFSFICLGNTSDLLNTLFRKHGKRFYEDLAGIVSPWNDVQDPKSPSNSGETDKPASDPFSFTSFEQEAIAGRYEDPETAHILEVTPSISEASVCENFSQKFSIVPAAGGTSKALTYVAKSRNWRCTFLREGDTQDGPYMRIIVENASGEKGDSPTRIFRRFFSAPLAMDALHAFAGDYVCQRLRAGYQVVPTEVGIKLQNLDPRNDMLNVVFTPTIQDMFIARYPPAINWYVVHFQRDSNGKVIAFTFRDDVPGRENWVFDRVL